MNQVITIALKEIVDGVRDVRSVMASAFYALMGPVVVGLVSMAVGRKGDSASAMLTSMMAIFTLVSAFVGGMNVAMDTVAGERERKSLLPLLLNEIPRARIVIGKWLGVSVFAVAGLALNLAGFAVVLTLSGIQPGRLGDLLLLAWSLFTLALLAASIQLMISAASHAVKEAQTYLSLAVFAPMAIGMFMVFSHSSKSETLSYLPLAGQQLQLQALMNGRALDLWQPIAVGGLTLLSAMLLLIVSTNRLQRDEILYGN